MKSLLVLLTLTMSVSAFARDSYEGRFTKNDGTTIVRIEVGNDRDNDTRAMTRRIIQLERAVRELQNRVYDLEDDARPLTREVTLYTCSMRSNFNEFFAGDESLSEAQARASVIGKCTKVRHPMFCEDTKVKCDSRKEIQRI